MYRIVDFARPSLVEGTSFGRSVPADCHVEEQARAEAAGSIESHTMLDLFDWDDVLLWVQRSVG